MSDPEIELVDAIADDPFDASRRLVYADWLVARGDPRGELILVQTAAAERPDDADLVVHEQRLRAMIEPLFGLPEGASLVWDRGLATISLGDLDAPLDLPCYRSVRGFSVRTIDEQRFARVVRALPWATSASVGGWPPFMGPTLGPLRLRALDVRGSVRRVGMTDLLARPWRLRRLAMRLPKTNIPLDQLAPILDGAIFPELDELGIFDYGPMNTLVPRLVASPLFERLRWLGLQPSLLDPEAWQALVASPRLATMTLDTSHWHVDWLRLGDLLRELGRPAEALQWYERLLRAKSHLEPASFGQASALCDLGRPDEALPIIDALIAVQTTPERLALRARATGSG